MSINKCVHSFLDFEMIRVEMSPVVINDNGYSYPVTGSFISFFYPYTEDRLQTLLRNKENVIDVDVNFFVKRLIVFSDNNVELVFVHKFIEQIRNKNCIFGIKSESDLQNSNDVIAYKFTHLETALMHLKSDDNLDFLPDEEIQLIRKDCYVVLNNKKVIFIESNENGEREVFVSNIQNIEFENGIVKKVTSFGYWALTENVNITIEFNQDPCKVFNRSDDNAVITINYDRVTKWQWSLINGDYLGKINVRLN